MSNKTFFEKVNKRESMEHMNWLNNLHNFIKKNPEEYPSDLKDLMGICGLTIDFESVSLYQSFHAFLIRQRKRTDEAFSILIDDGWFTKYISEGLTEEQIYDKFIDTCLSWDIVPLYYDDDGLYKLIDLHSFMMIKMERIRSTCTEISNKIKVIQETAKVLPYTVISDIEHMKETDNIKALVDARDQLNKLLPEKLED